MFKLLNDLREEVKRYKVLDIAKHTGLSRRCIYNLLDEKNKTINLNTLQKLIDFFEKGNLDVK